MTRLRSFDRRSTINGAIYVGTYTYPQTAYAGVRGTSEDVVGSYQTDNLLDIKVQRRHFSCATGIRVSSIRRELQNCPLQHSAFLVIPYGSDPFTMPSDSVVQGCVSRMNPSQPAVLLPAAVGELRELPQMLAQLPLMIRGWGRHLIRPRKVSRRAQALRDLRKVIQDGGSSYLGWRFGWAPFIGDLSTLLNITEDIVRRLQWMLRLQAGEPIKRRVLLPYERVVVEHGRTLMHSNQAMIYANKVSVYRARSWITTRWVPLFPSMYRGAVLGDLFQAARRQALGLTTMGALQSWWELLPWSWLTDWFVNVGQKLALMNNSMMLRCASICWCRTSEYDGYFTIVEKPTWVTLSGTDNFWSCRKERKSLSTVDMFKDPPPSLPALTGRQMGILGALFASRM